MHVALVFNLYQIIKNSFHTFIGSFLSMGRIGEESRTKQDAGNTASSNCPAI